MKVAVLLSGQPRSYERYIHCIKKNLIEPNNADVFFHTWSEDQTLIYNLVSAYKPKDYITQPQQIFINNDVDFQHTLQSGYAGGAEDPKVAQYYTFATKSMWFSLAKGFNIIAENRVLYDYVIKCRFDCGMSRPIVCTNYDPNALWAEDLGRPELVNNWLNFGSFRTMQKYCSIYHWIPRLYRNTNIWCNEYWIKQIMDEENIPIKHDYWGLTIENTDIRTIK